MRFDYLQRSASTGRRPVHDSNRLIPPRRAILPPGFPSYRSYEQPERVRLPGLNRQSTMRMIWNGTLGMRSVEVSK